jgi:ABC-2 type transport system permease protein
VFLSLIDRDWQFNPQNNGINAVDIYGSVLLLLAAIVIVALAVALSARFNIVVTLSACIGIFLLGLVSDYTFGRFAETQLWAKIGRFLVPNLQIFWISDAIYEGSVVPLRYIGISAFYAVCYTTAILLIAIALFQRRQVG